MATSLLRTVTAANSVKVSLPQDKIGPWATRSMGVFGYFGGTKNGTSGAQIKILRPLFNTNTPPKTPI